MYHKLTAIGKLSVPTNRCRLFLAGEGRNGKTSTRKTLTGHPFDPDEASTRGTDQQGVELLNLKRTDASDWKPQRPCSVQHKRAMAGLIAGVLAGAAGCTIEDLRAVGIEHTLLGKIQEKVAKCQAEAAAAAAAAAMATTDDGAKSATADDPGVSDTPVTQAAAPAALEMKTGVQPVKSAVTQDTDAQPLPALTVDNAVRPASAVLATKSGNQPLPAQLETDEPVQPVPELDEEMDAIVKEYLETPSMAQPLHMQMWDFGGERPCRAMHRRCPTSALGRCILEPCDDRNASSPC